MREAIISISLLLAVLPYVGCKKVTVDFSYSPTQPKTGEKVYFTNLSSGGEDYTWTFGDNQTAESKTPTHTYNHAGTYVVTLTESKTKKVVEHTLSVVDSLPGISISTDTLYTFTPVTLTAAIWNPFAHSCTYQWHIDSTMVLLSARLDTCAICVYFASAKQSTILLDVTMDGETRQASRTYEPILTPARTLIMRQEKGDYSQRIYDIGTEPLQPMTYERGRTILDTCTITHSVTDNAERKVYYTTSDGLFVKNNNDTYPTLLDSRVPSQIALSGALNRVFYATSEGVYALPLVHTYNNQTIAHPTRINHLTNIQKLSIDEEER